MPVDPTEFIERLFDPANPLRSGNAARQEQSVQPAPQPSDNVGQGSTATYCSAFGGTHHMVSHMQGGARVHVERCSMCGWIDFDDLNRQVEEQIGKTNAPPEHVEQPAPVPNDSTPIVDLVVADLLERKQLGISRYGVALQSGNGRDMERDLYEELADALIYQRGAMEDRRAERERLDAVLGAARDLVGRAGRMLDQWAERSDDPTRTKDLWTPLHQAADDLHEALEAYDAATPVRRTA